jgi:CheY-like chemotaxis protein
LLLEDSPEDVDLIERVLGRAGVNFTLHVVKKKEEYEQTLYHLKPDIILSDHSLPQFNSIEAMQIWKEYQSTNNVAIPFILITGSVSEEFAVQSIKAGADDYILKDRLKRLPSSLIGALEKARIEKERVSYMTEVVSQAALMKEAEHLANFGSWQIDLRTGKHQWSDEAFRIFGFQPGEFDPDHEKFFMHIHPEDKQTWQHIIREAASVPVHECEFRIIDKGQQVKHIHSRIMVKRDNNDCPAQLIGFSIDITRQKQQTLTLETQNRKLMEIAWVQSHEVRAPLARIMGLVEVLNRCPDDDINVRLALDHIIKSAHELDGIIRKIVRKTEDFR